MSLLLTELKYFSFLLVVPIIAGQNLTRYDLIHYLLKDRHYDPSLPPEFYTENITTVAVELSIYDLNSESDIKMEYECALYLRMNWIDQRLDFSANETTYDSLSLGDAVVNKIWIPDLYFHHERKAEMHGLFTKNQLVYLYKNGSVFYSGRFNIKSHCQMDLKKYPFDTQTCPIVIQSYSLNKDELLLRWNGNKAVNIDKHVNLESIEQSLKQSYESPYDNPVGLFSTLSAEITFKRPKLSFGIMYVAPPIIIFGVSMTSFLLGDDIASRITIPTGAFTQLTMQWVGIYNQQVPAASVITTFDRWMLGNLCFVGAVLLFNAFICHFIYLEKTEMEKKQEKVKAKDPSKNVERQAVEDLINLAVVPYVDNPENTVTVVEMTCMNPRRDCSTENGDEKNPKKAFFELLKEKDGITTNTTWEEAKEIIQNDSRYSVSIKEMNTWYNDFIDQEKEFEKDFRHLIEDNEDITTNTKWDDAKKIVKDDPRYNRVCRKNRASQLYQDYIEEEKKNDFLSLLAEKASTIEDWEKAVLKIDHDPRYIITDDDNKRKSWFEEYRQSQDCIFQVKEMFCSRKKDIHRWFQVNPIVRIRRNTTVNSISFIVLAICYIIFSIVFVDCWKK